MFKSTRRKPASHARLNIAVDCWNDSIEKHLRRVIKDAVHQGCAIGVRIVVAPPNSSRFSVSE
jgi:6,7-dimethyl-8-ribityllumazine synthase